MRVSVCRIAQYYPEQPYRKSNYYFRVYKKSNGREIRFELEIKKTGLKNFQYYLFSNQFQVFEELMVKQFYKQSLNLFIHDSCYTDWFMSNFRKTKKVDIKTNPLIGTYLKQIIFECEEYLFQFFQLLSYLQDPQNYVELQAVTIHRQSYKVLSFPVNRFLEFTGKKKNNYYQMNKLIDFLTSLQRLPPIVDFFMDTGFKSVVAFPYIELDRREKQYVRIAITQELYYYNYPFHFPKQFLNTHGIYDLKIKIFIMQSFAIYELKKELRVQDFLHQFHISNSKNLKLRKDLLKIMQQLQDQKFIKSQFIIKNKQQKKTEVTKLTLKLITQSESIFYFENIQQNYF